ncbi:hypothetical protein QYS49_23230 [Marivirga salinae]|uniref:Uncharacterized protein n=1 Tax=Marivirga salinarum TaxID=3059078 RepID=A0AA49GG76_9BACT|nr:hypothetical protein [Marivirga sp. BDSF4-3]WKK74600.2 hypothetical protein QYS49_23230 [Marivirga sp. BDSF4-3]
MKKINLQLISAIFSIFVLISCSQDEPLWPKKLEYSATYTMIEDSTHTGFSYQINGVLGGTEYSFGSVDEKKHSFPYYKTIKRDFSEQDLLDFEFKALSPIEVTIYMSFQENKFLIYPEDGKKTITLKPNHLAIGEILVQVKRIAMDESEYTMIIDYPNGTKEHSLGFGFSKGGYIFQRFSATATREDTIILSVVSPYSFEMEFKNNEGEVLISDSVISKNYKARGTLELIPGIHF